MVAPLAPQDAAFEKGKRRPIDPRIPTLIANGVAGHHRSLFLMVGSPKQQHNQIVNLHYLLSQARLSSTTLKHGKAASRPTVLWTYKKEMTFTSNRKKREAKIKRDVKRGLREEGEMDPFELFVGVTDIRYCYYKDTDKILGQTFGMLVLQDFEAITPNLLARTIETVEGGGIVVILLQSMTSLKQLYTMSMDAHSRYRTESSDAPVARFNERFLLSLGPCDACLVLDDELNVLPISKAKDVEAIEAKGKGKLTAADAELDELKESLRETKPVGEIVNESRTIDQAKAILTFTDAIASKTLAQTVALTAARGRGKSAALGFSIALAVAHSYSNIFVTSPSPENLKTLFEFIFKGFDKLGYEEHLDYDIVQSTNPEWKGAVVRVNIFRDHRQTIQYIQPQDAHVLGQAELVVIDEAAAIPLPLVRKLLGPYLVFMASTINGYEGTGRSLSLKLLQQLREGTAVSASNGASGSKSSGGRALREIKLDTPIRYGPGDAVETWLNSLLCLDATTTPVRGGIQGSPLPAQCDLFAVDRDALFSFHPASEIFLQRMMALYVASHYKNSPNDLQLMSDAPQHRLFVLLPPIRPGENDNVLPEPLVVVQVALEGRISKESILGSLTRGQRAGGDLIPWTMSQQFQDDEFASLSGARIVRIAAHPDYAKMGYGSRALQALDAYYSGQLLNLDEAAKVGASESFEQASRVKAGTDLHSETIRVRDAAKMPPLLHRLSDIKPEAIDWIGSSFGLTPPLFRFWKRAGYVPLYVRQTENDLTGEHTAVVLRGLTSTREQTAPWLSAFAQDFRKRFLSLLSFAFREVPAVNALSILEAASSVELPEQRRPFMTADDVQASFSPFDMKRLTSYANNLLDYHAILDLLPSLATLYFTHRLADPSEAAAAASTPAPLKLSAVQSAILLVLGLQRRSIEAVETELGLPVAQALALFVKAVRKLSRALEAPRAKVLGAQVVPPHETMAATARAPVAQPIAEELDEASRGLREAVDELDLAKYAIEDGAEGDWAEAEARVAAGIEGRSTVVSIKGKRKANDDDAAQPVEAPVKAKKPKKHREDRERDGGGKKEKKHKQKHRS